MQFEQSGDRAGDRGKADETSRTFPAEDVGARRRERDAWSDDPSGRDTSDDGEPARPAREGLPKRFRMRHGRHYVDELLGDAPLRTVREIPISEIAPPDEDRLDFARRERLESSIRALGVMEPLLVARRGLEYRVIAGMRRLRAARTVGLNTVPCLVHDVNDERLDTMRDAARDRSADTTVPFNAPSTPAGPVTHESSDVPVAVAASAGPELPIAVAAADEDRSFLSALLAAKGPGIDERLRLAVLTELAEVELLRAKIASAAADALMRTAPLEKSPVSCAALVADAVSAIGTEARLRGVAIERIGPSPDVSMPLDAGGCRVALTGLLQAMLTLTPAVPATLRVETEITHVRPALLIDCAWRGRASDAIVIADEARARFFDPDWREHPCGESGARVLAMLARTARAHGGRVQAGISGVTFVVPRPLSDI